MRLLPLHAALHLFVDMSIFLDMEAVDNFAVDDSPGTSYRREQEDDFLDHSDEDPEQPLCRRKRIFQFSDSDESEDEPSAHKKKKRHSSKQDRDSSKRHSSHVSSASLFEEVKKSNKLLQSLLKCVKKHETRIQAIEAEVKKTPSSGSTPGSTPSRTRKREVPDEVRVRVNGAKKCTYS